MNNTFENNEYSMVFNIIFPFYILKTHLLYFICEEKSHRNKASQQYRYIIITHPCHFL